VFRLRGEEDTVRGCCLAQLGYPALAILGLAGTLLAAAPAHAGCGKGGGAEGGKQRRTPGGFGGVGISIDLGDVIDRTRRRPAEAPAAPALPQADLVEDDEPLAPEDREWVRDLAESFASGFGGATVAVPISDTPTPGGPQIAQPAPAPQGEQDDAVCGIDLEHDIDSWIPEAHTGDKTTLTAKIYRKAGNDWLHPGPARVITFEFVQRSSEKGECLNHGEGREPDLFFPQALNAPRLQCLDDPVGQGRHFGTARTPRPVVSEQVTVESDDYGSFGSVRATAPRCVPLDRAGNGKLVEVPQRQADEKVPRDDNDNQIADAYERREARQPKANADDDEVPKGSGVAGDGLSAYEEYRGFLVQGRHVRSKWGQKDLFVFDRDGVGLGRYPQASGFACHLIREQEFSAERVVNRNGGHAHVVDQHGLRLESEDLENLHGHSGKGPPKNVEAVKVDKNDFVFGVTRRTFNEQAFHETVAHELGHATGAAHHSDFVLTREGVFTTFYPPGQVPAGAKLAWAASWVLPPINGEYVEHTAATLCGEKLPKIFFVGTKQNRHSGNTSCLMRYKHANPETVYQGAGGWECIDREPARELFCESRDGTGYNAGGKCAGDAVNGNCKHQLVVNDAAD
jgi:hypothetical protein